MLKKCHLLLLYYLQIIKWFIKRAFFIDSMQLFFPQLICEKVISIEIFCNEFDKNRFNWNNVCNNRTKSKIGSIQEMLPAAFCDFILLKSHTPNLTKIEKFNSSNNSQNIFVKTWIKSDDVSSCFLVMPFYWKSHTPHWSNIDSIPKIPPAPFLSFISIANSWNKFVNIDWIFILTHNQ